MEDRRQFERHNFSATAEVTDMVSGTRLSTRAADLSPTGCYLDSLNPFTVGSKVRLRIVWDGAELVCTAIVRDSQPGMGMGVAFTDLDPAPKAVIERWIRKMGSYRPADVPPSPLSDIARPGSPTDRRDDLAARLIDLLLKKGLLSSNEVASLLRDRIV